MLKDLDQAASRAEQAAQRLKTSVRTPFTQLDYEAEYPGWPSSRHITSSKSNSTPTSVDELATSSSIHASSCAENLNSVSANDLYARPSISESSVDPLQGVSRKTRTSRNQDSPRDKEYYENKEKRKSRRASTRAPNYATIDEKGQVRQSRDLGAHSGHCGRRVSRPSSMEGSISRNSPQLPGSGPRSFTDSRRRIHKEGLLDLSGSPETADPASVIESHLRVTAPLGTSTYAPSQFSTSNSPTAYTQTDAQRLVYRDLVAPVIQSMINHHKRLCPELDGLAIRREVLLELIETVLPNTLHDGQYPSKRQRKVIRRFAKELCSRKILQYTATLEKLSISSSEYPRSRPRTTSNRTSSCSSYINVLPSRNHQRNSLSAEAISALQLERVGLSPPPHDALDSSARSSLGMQHSRSVSNQESVKVEGMIMDLHDSEDSHHTDDESALYSPSNQLTMHVPNRRIEEQLWRKLILPSQYEKGSKVISSSEILDENSRRDAYPHGTCTSPTKLQNPLDESSPANSKAPCLQEVQKVAPTLLKHHQTGQSVNQESLREGKPGNLDLTKTSECSTSPESQESAITQTFNLNELLVQRYENKAQDAIPATMPNQRSSEIIVLSDDENPVLPDPVTCSDKSNRHATTKETENPDHNAEIAAYLYQRTLGRNHDSFTTQRSLRYAVIDSIKPQNSWKGASGDIVSAAWNPNSQTYAIGATATSNAEDLQYNRPNNLLYGDVTRNTLHELPEHRIDRPKPGTIVNGPNSHQAVYEACDPKVYKTVSAIQFSPEGTSLLTASHDCTVKLWDVRNDELPVCVKTLDHGTNVSQLEVSPRLSRIFATGSQTTGDAIRIYSETSTEHEYVSLKSARAQIRPEHEIFPECLRWGNTSATEHLLLAGFARWGELPNNNPGREGELCIWDVNTGQQVKKTPSSQSVCTASFHPFLGLVATGGSPGTGLLTHKYTTKTVVRFWDMRVPDPGRKLELECPALDMQDLVFHPQNVNILAVGCTDGAVYVWDCRIPEHVLHKLQHGEPIADWDNKYNGLSREQGDAGVTMTLWGAGQTHLYTGATDGVVKRWNVNYAPEDALVKDIAQLPAGVSCGSFSPDHVNLLVGDSTGGVHLLSSDPGFPSEESYFFESGKGSKAAPIKFVPAPRNGPIPPESEPGQGQLASIELLESGQLQYIEEFGVIGQGPAYSGPYANYAHKDGNPQRGLLPHFEMQQPVRSKTGESRDNAAARNIKATTARRREELNQALEAEKGSYDGTKPNSIRAEASSKSSKKRKHSDLDELSNPLSFKKMKAMDVVDLASTISSKESKVIGVVDLTSDAEEKSVTSDVIVKQEVLSVESASDAAGDLVGDGTDSDGVGDDHWFPYMDLDVFARLKLDA